MVIFIQKKRICTGTALERIDIVLDVIVTNKRDDTLTEFTTAKEE